MNNLVLLNVTVLFLGVMGAVALDVNKADTARSSRLSARADSDPWITLTRVPKEGDASSQLFRECLKSSRTDEYKPSAVVGPSTGLTYWRYEVSRYRKDDQPSTWDQVLPNMEDIFDCADAAADYRLFKFEDNNCLLSNRSFDVKDIAVGFGEQEGTKDVLFLNLDKPPSPSCLGNGERIGGENGPCVYVVAFETPLSFFAGVLGSLCGLKYSSDVYSETEALPFPALQNYLRTNMITGEFMVFSLLSKETAQLEWPSEEPVNPTYIVESSFTHYENIIFPVISSDNDYKLMGIDIMSGYSGVICVNYD